MAFVKILRSRWHLTLSILLFFVFLFTDSLLDLLLCLVHSSNSVCDSRHLAVWFGAYGASLTLTDQKLLHLIELYEGQGCEVTRYRWDNIHNSLFVGWYRLPLSLLVISFPFQYMISQYIYIYKIYHIIL